MSHQMQDFALDAKAELLQTGKCPEPSRHAVKLEQAIAKLGRRYVLHKSNRVKKLPEPFEGYAEGQAVI